MIRRGLFYSCVTCLLFVVFSPNANSQPVRITPDQLGLLVNSYLQCAAESWRYPYRSALSQNADPYETDAEKNVRVERALDSTLTFLADVYDRAITWKFEVLFPLDTVRYNPNNGMASASLPQIAIPSSEGESRNLGLTKGHLYPNMYYALGPLWRHTYYHNTVKKRHFLGGALKAQLTNEKARAIDIVNNPGTLSVILQFDKVNLPDGTIDCDRAIDFPALMMLEANWIVGSDTIYRCGKGSGEPPGALTIPGESRVIGKSPVVKIKYAFQNAIPPFRRIKEIHNPLMNQLGLDIDGVNSAYFSPAGNPKGVLAIDGTNEDTRIVIDGIVCKTPFEFASLAVGWHNLRFEAPCSGHRNQKVRVREGDTTRIEYHDNALAGKWISYWSAAGVGGNKLQMEIKQTDQEMFVTYEGKTYKAETGHDNYEFWDKTGSQSFTYDIANETKMIHVNGCNAFNFGNGSVHGNSYNRYFFFLSDDGEQLVGKKLEKSSGLLESRTYPNGKVSAPIILVRSN